MAKTDGQRLVAYFVDECVEQGRSEMVPMKGQVARQVKALLDADVPPAEVERTLRAFVERQGRTALQVPEIYAELARNENEDPAQRPDVRRRTQEWIGENGWPTGARFVRGTHGGTYVFHPLGGERVPGNYDWPYPRPTFEQVARELERSGEFESPESPKVRSA